MSGPPQTSIRTADSLPMEFVKKLVHRKESERVVPRMQGREAIQTGMSRTARHHMTTKQLALLLQQRPPRTVEFIAKTFECGRVGPSIRGEGVKWSESVLEAIPAFHGNCNAERSSTDGQWIRDCALCSCPLPAAMRSS